MRVSALLLLAVCAQHTFGQSQVKVGLRPGNSNQVIEIFTSSGGFEWVGREGNVLGPLGRQQSVQLQNGKLQLSLGLVDYVYLRPYLPESTFRLKTAGTPATLHSGGLHIFPGKSGIQCVLDVDMETYLQGVLSAEAGKGHHPEYYRAQAIVSRTYTVQSMGRHHMEGFDLCDAVHCQAYHGLMTVNDTLRQAVLSTAGEILVDRMGKAITAAFHSNCGGQTQGAENVWQHPLSYLVGREDMFCRAMPHALWTRSVPSEEWSQWLDEQRDKSSERTTFLTADRLEMLPDSGVAVRAADVRARFGFPSSYFVSVDDGNEVRFIGHGYGHGVGLCQEGAMERARQGQSAATILHHYYTNVRITSMESLPMFRE